MKKSTKVISGIIAFILMGGLLFFANGMVGNPVSKFLVNKNAKNYVEEAYPDMDLELEKANYDFKRGLYNVEVKSPKSIDTHFPLDFSPTGKLEADGYSNYVLENWNTYERVNEEYRNLADAIFEPDRFPYKSDVYFGEFKLKEDEEAGIFGPTYGIELEELERDKIYDIRELAKTEGHIVLYVEDEKLDVERGAEILLHIKEIFDEENLPFYAIDFSLRQPSGEENINYKEEFQVNEFLYEDIYEEGLATRLEKAAAELEGYYKDEDGKKD